MLATQLILPTGASAAEPCPAERPPFSLLRYDESYTFLENPECRTEFWDAVKYIPLGRRSGWYLSLGGDFRERYEFFHNEDAGSAPADRDGNNSYVRHRYLLHGDLHLGPSFRIFAQFLAGLETGRTGGPRPEIDEDAFDLHQAFVDLVLPLGRDSSLTSRLGRQELSYGSGRLVDVREVNLPRSFDAARLLLRTGGWAVDGFWSKPVRNRTGVFDDDTDPDRSLWSVYAVTPLALLPDGHADLYYLGYENRRAQFDQGSGYELRHTFGFRLWGQPGRWEYDVEFIGQVGQFSSGTIGAWGIASTTHYTFTRLPLRPRPGLRADVTSGDQDPRSVNLQTFNPLFPTGAYYNLGDPVGPQNLIHVHPVVDLHFGGAMTLTMDWAFFWRTSLDDGLYRLAGSVFRTGQLSRERYVGSAPAVTLRWAPTRHISVLAGYVHFFAGPFLRETPPGKDTDYFTIWVAYKF
jgi:Alginate export